MEYVRFAVLSVANILLLCLFACVRIECRNETTKHADGVHHLQEFCTGETFEPHCAGNDVIVILSARYGRMKIGRCVKDDPVLRAMMDDPKILGCSADVSRTVGRHCSGRSDCSFRVLDQHFDNVQPCYETMKMYLEVSYMCVKVAAESRDCTVSVSTEAQHIVGKSRLQSSTVGSRCGDRSQPWTVDALAGQRIVVSLLDFNANNADNTVTTMEIGRRDSTRECRPPYGHVIDIAARKNVSICGTGKLGESGQQQMQLRNIYTSSSNSVLISLNEASEEEATGFIVHVSALGCSDLAPPSDVAWLKRDVDEIVVGCYTSRQTWRVRCVDGRWRGTVGQCTEYTQQQISDDSSNRSVQDTTVESNYLATLSIVAVSCAGVAVCCIIICVGVACLNRQHKNVTNKKAMMSDNDQLQFDLGSEYGVNYVVHAAPARPTA